MKEKYFLSQKLRDSVAGRLAFKELLKVLQREGEYFVRVCVLGAGGTCHLAWLVGWPGVETRHPAV